MDRYSIIKVRHQITSGWSISRILSSGLLRLCSHLSGRCVAAPLDAAYPRLASPTRGKSTYGNEQFPIVHGRNRPCLALLPTGVTWPLALRRAPVVSYTTFSPSPTCVGCLFLWPFYPVGSRLTAVSPPRGTLRRRALWSADFPRSRQRRTATARPA